MGGKITRQKKQFLNNVVHFCALRNFRAIGNNSYFYSIVDLPDFTINNCGVRYGSSLYLKTKKILNKDAKSDIKRMLKKLSKVHPSLKRVINKKYHNGSW